MKTTDEERVIGNDVDGLLEERERLNKMFHDKFMKLITVMFTDLKGSTSLTDSHGDLAGRTLIKHHNDIVLPIIKKNNGILVKTMGDGTMSYFTTAQDAVRAASQIQSGIDGFNLTKTLAHPILIRIGIHTGEGIVEQNDIFGDVVNVASRFESIANPGEIYLSEETFSALTDKGEVYCRFIKTTTLKGKKDPFNVYKVFWNPEEVEADKTENKPVKEEADKKMSPVVKALIILIPVAIIIFSIVIKGLDFFKGGSSEETRSKHHSVTPP